MKRLHSDQRVQHCSRGLNFLDAIDTFRPKRCQQKLPIYVFLGLCFNVVLASSVLAASGGGIDRSQAYWLTALGLVTVALSIYLFVVMFAPEKF